MLLNPVPWFLIWQVYSFPDVYPLIIVTNHILKDVFQLLEPIFSVTSDSILSFNQLPLDKVNVASYLLLKKGLPLRACTRNAAEYLFSYEPAILF